MSGPRADHAPARLLGRLAALHARLDAFVLAGAAIAYIATWQWDPYVYGFCVLGLAPAQLGWAAAGLVRVAARHATGRIARSLLLVVAHAASAIAAFAALRSIHWA